MSVNKFARSKVRRRATLRPRRLSLESLAERTLFAVSELGIATSESSETTADPSGGTAVIVQQPGQDFLVPDDGFSISRFDANGDGLFEPIDVLIFINLQLETAASRDLLSLDYTNNGVFDSEDLLLLLEKLNELDLETQAMSGLAPVPAATVGMDDAVDEPPDNGGQLLPKIIDVVLEHFLGNQNLTEVPQQEEVAPEKAINNCCTRPPDEESVRWDFGVDFVNDFDRKVDDILSRLPNGHVRPFLTMPGGTILPFALPGLPVPLTIPRGFDNFLRQISIRDIARIYLNGVRTALQSSSTPTRIVFAAARDKDMDPGCGCNMTEPKFMEFGPRISMSGNITFDFGVEIIDSSFRNDHRYPQNPVGMDPNDQNYDRGNLVDELASVRFNAFAKFGLDLDLSFLASGARIHQTLTVESGVTSAKMYCSKGTVIPDAPLLSPE